MFFSWFLRQTVIWSACSHLLTDERGQTAREQTGKDEDEPSSHNTHRSSRTYRFSLDTRPVRWHVTESELTMGILDHAMVGAVVGAIAGGVGLAIKSIRNRPAGQSVGPGKKVAATPEEPGTIAPVALREADQPIAPRPVPSPEAPASRPAPPAESPVASAAVGWLVVKSGATKGKRYDLTVGEIRIGRSESCQIRIMDDDAVSREHAMIRVLPQECKFCDLGSRNGTYLNSDKVDAPRRLQEGDILRIGAVEMLFIRA